MAPQALQDQQDHKELPEPVLLDQQDHRELLGQQDHKDHEDHKVLQEQVDLRVQLV